MTLYPIEGQKIHLRSPILDDLDTMAYWLHPDHEWHKLDGPYFPKTPADKIPETIERLRKRIEQLNLTTMQFRLVIVDNSTNKMLGMVTSYWLSQETNWLAQGIVLYDPDTWGKGIGYEAFGLWTQYLFDQEPKFVCLGLRTWSGNIGMMKLAEKLGYMLEATFRKAHIVNGEYYDGIGYGVLREEWETLYPNGFQSHLNTIKT